MMQQALAIFRFNPRARDGRDANYDSLGASFGVSIHAPVMDAMMLT